MELKSYYKLVFTNSAEYFVESEIPDTAKFKASLTSSGIFKDNNGDIVLQLKDSNPVHIKADKLFSTQKVNEGAISAQTRLWKLV